MKAVRTVLIHLLISLTLIAGGCASAPKLIDRDYSSSQALLRDYLKVPKLEFDSTYNEVSPDQKSYSLSYQLEKLPTDVAFMITNNWEMSSDGKLTFKVIKNSTHQALGAESLILKEFFDSLFTFADSPEQGLDFFSRVLLGDIDAIEEHVKRRIKNIDFQPAATLLDDYYPNTYLPALRSILGLTAKWRRFERNKRLELNGKPMTTWSELTRSWLQGDEQEKISNFTQTRELNPSFERYLEMMLETRMSKIPSRILMFYPVQESDQSAPIVAEAIKEGTFKLKPLASLVDLVKEQNEMENTSLFIQLYTSLGEASRHGAWGVAAVWVEPELLLPQNQGLFAQNKWLYPIGIRENAIYFKASPKDIRLSKDAKGEPRLSYFMNDNQVAKLMKSFDSTGEFRTFAREFWLKYYTDLINETTL